MGCVARAALASLQVLRHLDLGSGSVHCASTWKQLPPSMTSLKLGQPSRLPPGHVIQFRLKQLDIVCCNCNVLSRLLQASPADLQLSERRLMAPVNMAEELDLVSIVQHPAWHLANSGAPNCFPVKELYMEDYFPLRPHQLGYLSSRKILSSLPIMPSITDFSFSCEEAKGQGNLPVIQNPVRLLDHIPFAPKLVIPQPGQRPFIGLRPHRTACMYLPACHEARFQQVCVWTCADEAGGLHKHNSSSLAFKEHKYAFSHLMYTTQLPSEFSICLTLRAVRKAVAPYP